MALVWFITGVSSGLGLEIALNALEQGHKVVGTVRSRQRAAKEVERVESKGGKVLELDVTRAQACREVWHSAEQIHGHIDVLCNNAGMAHMGPVEDFTDEDMHAQMDVNLYGPFRLIRAALPGFRKRKAGTIVNVTSVSGIDGSLIPGPYSASKFALEGLSEGLAREMAEYNVKVLIVEPGAFRTNFLGAYKFNSMEHLEQYTVAQTTKKVIEMFSGKQRGDPGKAGERIVEAVSGSGPAGQLHGKILRLPLGPDCMDKFKAKIGSLSADLANVGDVGMSTDFAEA